MSPTVNSHSKVEVLMNRIAVVILLLCGAYSMALAQGSKTPAEVSEKQWQGVLVAANDEEWDKAFQLAAKYIKQMKEEDERLPRLRYIYLYTAAGSVSAGVMSFEELERVVKDFDGKEIELPYRPIAVDCHGDLNFICATESSKDKLIVAATNKAGTTIHAFEYVQLKEKFDAASHQGENASIGGVIEAIKLNPNKSRFLIMRIYITGGFVILKDQMQKQASIHSTQANNGMQRTRNTAPLLNSVARASR